MRAGIAAVEGVSYLFVSTCFAAYRQMGLAAGLGDTSRSFYEGRLLVAYYVACALAIDIPLHIHSAARSTMGTFPIVAEHSYHTSAGRYACEVRRRSSRREERVTNQLTPGSDSAFIAAPLWENTIHEDMT